MLIKFYGWIFVGLLAAASNASAATEAGKLAVANGDVKISGKAAKPGSVILNNDTITTGANASAKLLFTDQSIMDLGPNSSLNVSDYAVKDGENRTATFSLLYGKLRSLVTQKVGDGGKVQVKTNSAVMGVRGTEFVVDAPQASPGQAATAPAIVVVSGSVAVSPSGGGAPVMVGAGQMFVAQGGKFGGGSASGTTATTASAGSSSESSGSTTTSGTDAAATGAATGTSDSSGTASGVTQVSGEQMQSMLTTTTTQDTTFISAVAIAPASTSESSGSNTGSTALNSVTTAVASAVTTSTTTTTTNTALPPPPPMGATTTSFLPPVSIIPGNRVTLTVVVQ